ncbi:RNA dependent RNA polymerase domain containing protein [Elaphomyces granulatus]
MDIFCRNVPDHMQQKHLKKALKPILAELGIYTFECRKQAKGHATITILDRQQALALLEKYPKSPKGQKGKPEQAITILNSTVFIEEGRYPPDVYLLRSLEEEERNRRSNTSIGKNHEPNSRHRSFPIVSFSCGIFDYREDSPVFEEHFCMEPLYGGIKFERTRLRITVPKPDDNMSTYEIEINYWNINNSIYLGGSKMPSLTISCSMVPRLFEVNHNIESMPRPHPLWGKQTLSKKRIRHLGSRHKEIVATCFTYRVLLREARDLLRIQGLSDHKHFPDFDRWIDRRVAPQFPYSNQLGAFLGLLREESLPYIIKFQLQMFVYNGALPPLKVIDLFEHARDLYSRKDAEVARSIFHDLHEKIAFPNPNVDKADVEVECLKDILVELENSRSLNHQLGKPRYAHDNQTFVHRATVSPTGIYLSGPFLETKNRVLRRFSNYVDYFLRVEFSEEDGDIVMYDPTSDLEEVFEGQFKRVLNEGIIIADREFQFLGFSHSSLRARSCWFVAEFFIEGECFNAESIIPKLGNFLDIHSPAKYAARIGQTFSDTLTSIAIDRNHVTEVPDVMRNNRVFSDGCGTLSKEVLWKIYRQYAHRAKVKPTVFQIRLSGAKGMLSLDSRKTGEVVTLRKTMIKFEALEDWNIEICGAGIEKLPFLLNAQIIKLLEDLGVAPGVFIQLQEEEVESLRRAIQSQELTARFLEQSHIVAKSTQLPWLLRILGSLDMHYTSDDFLRRAIELAILVQLRDLKYRARIKVPKAVTLYGIMDETGILNEGEIFCPSLNEHSHREILVHKDVIVTRSPALHPGDIQLANAVDVPAGSPLRRLHNCVVFSQKGERDLPSMLSGGDLDGDLFNIIFDDRLRPGRIEKPADYPRGGQVILNRTITMNDITDFFITFMRQDQLGRIATTHKVLADQNMDGTMSTDCLTLAELHSTAVDFSKTGQPVDLRRIPKCPRYRPDFMAPGPRVEIADSIELLQDEKNYIFEDGDSDDDESGRPGYRYYKSERILGQLYRAIDENEFLDGLHDFPKSSKWGLLEKVWEYVKHETDGFIWDHHVKTGQDIRDIYEDEICQLMRQSSDRPWKATLTELEVFIGNIIGGSHKPTKRQKEVSKGMRDTYDSLIQSTVSMIIDRESGGTESLERSIACFWVAHHESQRRSINEMELQSFPWITAITCLQEVEKLRMTTPMF